MHVQAVAHALADVVRGVADGTERARDTFEITFASVTQANATRRSLKQQKAEKLL